MGKDPSTERPRRSSSRPVPLTTDRYGRRVRDRDEKERSYKRRDFARDDSRERKDMISIRRGRGREDSRERERNRRRGTEEAYSYNRQKLDGNQTERSESRTSPQTQGKHWQDSVMRQAHSDGKIHSRWSKTSQYGHDDDIVNDESGKIEHSNGGVYGPADRNRGVGGRIQWNGSPRDESWVECRLKLRSEATQPRGVWNTSPSPPRRKVVKVTEVDKVKSSSVEKEKIQSRGRRKKDDSKYVQRRSSSTNLKKSELKLRKTLPPTAISSDSGGGSSDSSSGSSNGSSSGSSSDSSSHNESESESLGSDSSGDECANPKKSLGKRKKRPLPTKTVRFFSRTFSGRYPPIND